MGSTALESFCLGVLEDIGKRRWSVSIVLCDDSFIRELNGTYRGIYEPTDVLSFAQNTEFQSEDLHLAGDVIVSLETMKKNAQNLNTSEKHELKRLLVHGILHLAGMDHEKDATEGGMLDLQESILKNNSGE
jgi:probable rRNA maturation factor